MKVRAVYSSKLPPLFGASAITLYPFVFFAMARDDQWAEETVRHECVHVRQVRALGWWRFYASYIWQWLKMRVAGKSSDAAYRGITYEAEAYRLQGTIMLTDSERAEFYR